MCGFYPVLSFPTESLDCVFGQKFNNCDMAGCYFPSLTSIFWGNDT